MTGSTPLEPRLRRALTLSDLVLYGIVVISPMAPMGIFGVLSERGRGHVVTALLIAMVAMLLTGISYGRMARAYPSAGSAYTYVAREIHPSLGYVTGWGMVLDYVVNPICCTVWCAEMSNSFVPAVPVLAWKILYAGAITALNVRGIRSSARINIGMTVGQCLVVVVILIAAARYIFGQPQSDPLFWTRPFYDPQTFSFGALLGSTAIAVLSYIGFDGISTLSEETANPRRDIMRATVLTCVLIGLLSAVEAYAAQLIWPAGEPFPNVDTAYVTIVGRAWPPLVNVVGLTLIVGTFAAGLAQQLGAARLLYAMGRSNALPQHFFGAIEPRHRVPRNSVIFVGAVVMVGSVFLSYRLAAEVLNFGALIAFMGVNSAAFLRYFWRAHRKELANFIPPVLGFLICLALWWNLSDQAKVLGSVWIAAGVAFGVLSTRGFRVPLSLELPPE
jgi:amino acid transporter